MRFQEMFCLCTKGDRPADRTSTDGPRCSAFQGGRAIGPPSCSWQLIYCLVPLIAREIIIKALLVLFSARITKGRLGIGVWPSSALVSLPGVPAGQREGNAVCAAVALALAPVIVKLLLASPTLFEAWNVFATVPMAKVLEQHLQGGEAC